MNKKWHYSSFLNICSGVWGKGVSLVVGSELWVKITHYFPSLPYPLPNPHLTTTSKQRVRVLCLLGCLLLFAITIIGCSQSSPSPATTTTTTTTSSSTTTTNPYPGANWTCATAEAAFAARGYHSAVGFDSKLWVIGGYYYYSSQDVYKDVWYSSDGITWTQATANAGFGKLYAHSSVVFDDKLWVIGGRSPDDIYYNGVWSSSDGASWTQATSEANFGGRSFQGSTVYANKIWVIGGIAQTYPSPNLNDVWHSTDGITWTRATANASFSSREAFGCVTFDNKLWVVGGYNSDTSIAQNDVWYSTDGITWTCATAEAAWSARKSPTCTVYDSKIWVINGINAAGALQNDVWYSSDGITWICATAAADFSKREGHAVVTLDNIMWVIGGLDNDAYRNDVWYSQ